MKKNSHVLSFFKKTFLSLTVLSMCCTQLYAEDVEQTQETTEETAQSEDTETTVEETTDQEDTQESGAVLPPVQQESEEEEEIDESSDDTEYQELVQKRNTYTLNRNSTDITYINRTDHGVTVSIPVEDSSSAPDYTLSVTDQEDSDGRLTRKIQKYLLTSSKAATPRMIASGSSARIFTLTLSDNPTDWFIRFTVDPEKKDQYVLVRIEGTTVTEIDWLDAEVATDYSLNDLKDNEIFTLLDQQGMQDQQGTYALLRAEDYTLISSEDLSAYVKTDDLEGASATFSVQKPADYLETDNGKKAKKALEEELKSDNKEFVDAEVWNILKSPESTAFTVLFPAPARETEYVLYSVADNGQITKLDPEEVTDDTDDLNSVGYLKLSMMAGGIFLLATIQEKEPEPTPVYQVKFYKDASGTEVLYEGEFEEGSSYIIPATMTLPDDTGNGLEFTGWQIQDQQYLYTTGEKITVDRDYLFLPVYTPGITVHFIDEFGDELTDPRKLLSDASVENIGNFGRGWIMDVAEAFGIKDIKANGKENYTLVGARADSPTGSECLYVDFLLEENYYSYDGLGATLLETNTIYLVYKEYFIVTFVENQNPTYGVISAEGKTLENEMDQVRVIKNERLNWHIDLETYPNKTKLYQVCSYSNSHPEYYQTEDTDYARGGDFSGIVTGSFVITIGYNDEGKLRATINDDPEAAYNNGNDIITEFVPTNSKVTFTWKAGDHRKMLSLNLNGYEFKEVPKKKDKGLTDTVEEKVFYNSTYKYKVTVKVKGINNSPLRQEYTITVEPYYSGQLFDEDLIFTVSYTNTANCELILSLHEWSLGTEYGYRGVRVARWTGEGLEDNSGNGLVSGASSYFTENTSTNYRPMQVYFFNLRPGFQFKSTSTATGRTHDEYGVLFRNSGDSSDNKYSGWYSGKIEDMPTGSNLKNGRASGVEGYTCANKDGEIGRFSYGAQDVDKWYGKKNITEDVKQQMLDLGYTHYVICVGRPFTATRPDYNLYFETQSSVSIRYVDSDGSVIADLPKNTYNMRQDLWSSVFITSTTVPEIIGFRTADYTYVKNNITAQAHVNPSLLAAVNARAPSVQEPTSYGRVFLGWKLLPAGDANGNKKSVTVNSQNIPVATDSDYNEYYRDHLYKTGELFWLTQKDADYALGKTYSNTSNNNYTFYFQAVYSDPIYTVEHYLVDEPEDPETGATLIKRDYIIAPQKGSVVFAIDETTTGNTDFAGYVLTTPAQEEMWENIQSVRRAVIGEDPAQTVLKLYYVEKERHVEAFITKELKTTDLVRQGFTFTFSVTPDKTQVENDTKEYPVVEDKVIQIGVDPESGTTSDLVQKDGDTVVRLQSVSIFENVDWSEYEDGLYSFIIRENWDQLLEYERTDTYKSWLLNSKARYLLQVTVADGKMKALTATQLYSDTGAVSNAKAYPERTNGNKGLDFENEYLIQMLDEDGTDPENPDVNGFAVSKIVSGTAAADEVFKVEITGTVPSLVSETQIHNFHMNGTDAEITSVVQAVTAVEGQTFADYWQANGKIPIDNGLDYTIYNKDQSIAGTGTLTSGVTSTVELKADQVLVFHEPFVGTQFTVQEVEVSGYNVITEYVYFGGNLTVQHTGLVSTEVTQKNDFVRFTNDTTDVPSTALDLDDHGFLWLIFVAAAGFMVLLYWRGHRNTAC